MKKLLYASLLFIAISCGQAKEKNRGYKVNIGEKAPNLSFTLLDGTKITNESL